RLKQGLQKILTWGLSIQFLTILGFAGCLLLALLVYKAVPRGFVPSEDQGYIIIAVQAPDGVSLNYTKKIMDKVEKIAIRQEEIKSAFAVTGYNYTGLAPNTGLCFVMLKPMEQRQGNEHLSKAVIQRLTKIYSQNVTEAVVIPTEPPAIQGFGNVGGFQFE